MDFSADIPIFLQDFAVTAIFGVAEIRGIFDNGFSNAFDVVGSAPSFTVASTAAATLIPGTSTLTIAAVSWLVLGVEDDGTGMAVVRLQRG